LYLLLFTNFKYYNKCLNRLPKLLIYQSRPAIKVIAIPSPLNMHRKASTKSALKRVALMMP